MRYRCLILDHDDTAVDSTSKVHHPAHVKAMEIIRPQERPVDLETWFSKNFEPGIMAYLTDELEMSAEELKVEHSVWREFTAGSQPDFYPGFVEALIAYRDRGGLLVVASHSEEDIIRSHYRNIINGYSVEPDLVFGWDLAPEHRKPHPYAVHETLRRLDLQPQEVLVVDDLKPGIDMAISGGVDAAAAGWSHNIPVIQSFMRRTCVATFDKVEEFAEFILR